MRFRPSPAHWFETYVPRNETVYALEALAGTGVVQLELDTRLAQPMDLASVGSLVERFQRLRNQHSDLLPAPGRTPGGRAEAAEVTARKAIDCLENWRSSLDSLLKRRRDLGRERRNLSLVREFIIAIQAESPGTDYLLRQSPFLYKGVFACPQTENLPSDICTSIDEFFTGDQHNFFIVVDEPGCHDIIDKVYQSKSCHSLQIPDWLPAERSDRLSLIDARLADIEVQHELTTQALEKKKSDPDLAAVLAEIDLLDWYMKHTAHLASAGKLCRVTGWTTAEKPDVLRQAFSNADIHGEIRFAEPPVISKVPVNMYQPWWARPFLFIVQMLGTPDSTEIDVSKLLPFVVPILFGYMFPDVGHGLMLVLFSIAMYYRWPTGRVLIPCGLSAMFFGVVFGEIFGLEHVMDPLWLKPLDHPLEVLLAPMLLGVCLIQLGLVFNAAQAVWRGEVRTWLLRDAAVMVLYPAALIGVFVPAVLWVAVIGAAWLLAGHMLGGHAGLLARTGKGFASLLQASIELLQNTLSFLRVGAFALAHSALSVAIFGLTEGISNEIAHALLLVLGHIFIVTLEGLVVFVQTTRLVLLEFFIHFLRGEGRMFSPLAEPPR